MIFSKLIIALTSPLGSSLVLGVLSLFLAYFGKRLSSVCVGTFALLWLLFWSMPYVSMSVRSSIESNFPATDIALLPSAPAMVVLGGAITPQSKSQRYANLSAAADRLRLAAQIFHLGKAPLIVLSGGGNLSVSHISEARAMQDFLYEMGVPYSVMLLEEKSQTTRENARQTSLLLQTHGVDQVLLITSALHMRRAKSHFESEGLNIIPAATDHEARELSNWEKWMPDADALKGSSSAIKEFLGWLAIRLGFR